MMKLLVLAIALVVGFLAGHHVGSSGEIVDRLRRQRAHRHYRTRAAIQAHRDFIAELGTHCHCDYCQPQGP